MALDLYLRHGGPLEQRVLRGEKLDADERALLVGRLIRLITRLHVASEKMRENPAGADLATAQSLLEHGRNILRRVFALQEMSEELDSKMSFRLEQLKFVHVYHEMTGHYHDLLAARSELEALTRELPDLPECVLAKDSLLAIDEALRGKHPKIEELWVGPFARLDDFAVAYPRSHWWWFQR